MTFADTLAAGFAIGKHLCVGIDPHNFLLADWGLENNAQGAEKFGRLVVSAAAQEALAVKPQVAFFERFGSAGYVALERIFADARAAKVPIIADVKRGDIGSTFASYADAWLVPGSPLEADAMTAVAYQGFLSLSGALDCVKEYGKGLFVLGATSNPEAREIQRALRADGDTVAASIVRAASAFNAVDEVAVCAGVGSVGVVLGATLKLIDFGIGNAALQQPPVLPILAPGFGAQGACLGDVKQLFGGLAKGLICSESRGVLAGNPAGLAQRIADRAQAVREALE